MSRVMRRFLSVFVAILIASPLVAPAKDASRGKATGVGSTEQPLRPFLHPLFSENIVLQRGVRTPVWGWTTPRSEVTVQLDGAKVSCRAGDDGKWIAQLPPHEAGGPFVLKVTGPEAVSLSNVMMGDVWLCSGQSNMEMGIRLCENGDEEVAAANHPNIRLFTVPKRFSLEPESHIQPLDPTQARWLVCTPENVGTNGWGGFTGVGYFFGRDLYEAIDVPIGLIHSSWGGTIAEAWTSTEGLKAVPGFADGITAFEAQVKRQRGSEFGKEMEAWWTANDPGTKAGWAEPGLDDSDWQPMDGMPRSWESRGLTNVDGIVWFRKIVELPETWAGAQATLSLAMIDDIDTTFVNGTEVGGKLNWHASREYALPEGLLKAGSNVIAVRILDTGGDGGFNGNADAMNLAAFGLETVPLAGTWKYKASAPLTEAEPVPPLVEEHANQLAALYNAMISPLVPFAIKGAIWYQGESNCGQPEVYRRLLPAMIKDWRHRFGVGDFPFLIVQLVNFGPVQTAPVEDGGWVPIRESQYVISKEVPNSGLACGIDAGEADNIHPRNKQEVGRRLSLIARATTYGEDIVHSGPVYRSMTIKGNEIILAFDHAGGGLRAKGDKLLGFAIAGRDGKFVFADASIAGDTVVLSSTDVPSPTMACYGWANNPIGSLYNAEGLPAVPFRTNTWTPNTTDLATVIGTGNLAGYFENVSAWLDQKTPAADELSEARLQALIRGDVFALALCQRQFLAKVGLDNATALAQAGEANRTFLTWVLGETEAMANCLEGATPVALAQRGADEWTIPLSALNIWGRIFHADPESRSGLFLRLAIATALNPPGSGDQETGHAAVDPLARYNHFKLAQKNKEVFPSFEHLSVWEYRQIVSSQASDEDLAWARDMINTWRPDLVVDERVVYSTSEVWPRSSPGPLTDNFKDLLARGGPSARRATWAVFICQAFGLPAIRVDQPDRACVAYKTSYPLVEPQFGHFWKIVYGRKWDLSTIAGVSGFEFVAGVEAQAHRAEFSTTERLRWLAGAVSSTACRTAIMDVAAGIAERIAVPDDFMREVLAIENVFSVLPFAGEPDETALLETFDGPNDGPDDYCSRIRGFVYPPQTADYVFFITSDDDSELLLSTDASPANKKHIAHVLGWSVEGRYHDQPTQQSQPVHLVAGQPYYIEAVQREGAGEDHLTVAWSGPGFTETVIQGRDLSPYPTGPRGKIGHEMWLHVSAMTRTTAAVKHEPPFTPAADVIHIEAEAFTNRYEVKVLSCHAGGRQVNFSSTIDGAWMEYIVDAPEAGLYTLTMQTAAAHPDQVFNVTAGAGGPVTVKIPLTYGLWGTTEPVAVGLVKGKQTLRVSAPNQRAVAIRWLDLKAGKTAETQSRIAMNKEMRALDIDHRTLVSRADLVYTKPVTNSVAGQPIGNGSMGSLIWTSSQALKFQINRADIFASDSDSDTNGGTDYCCGAGFVDIDFGGNKGVFTDRTFNQKLSCYDATIVTEGNGVKATTFTCDDPDVMVVRATDARKKPVPVAVHLRALRPAVVKTDGHTAVSKVQVVGNAIVLTQEFTEKSHLCRSAVAISMPGSRPTAAMVNEGEVTLTAAPGGRDTDIVIASAATFDPACDVVKKAINQLDRAESMGMDNVLQAGRAWWHAFWEKAFVSLHSEDGVADFVERQYTYYLYIMGSTSRGRYPAKFNGMLWSTAGDARSWGSHFWGANQSTLYNALPAANRLELMNPMFNMLSNSFASFERAAQQQWGAKGIYIPETVGFDGVPELPEPIAEEMRELYLDWKPWQEKSDGFLIYSRTKNAFLGRWSWKVGGKDADGVWHYNDRGQGPFCYVNHILWRGAAIAYQYYWRKYECTMDREWLATYAYPMIRGMAEFYRTYPNVWKEEDGKYHIHRVNDTEGSWGSKDTIHELSAMTAIFPTAIRASEILGVDEALRPLWREFAENISPLPLSTDYGGSTGRPVTFVAARKPDAALTDSATQGMMCFDLMTLESTNAALMKIANATFDAYFPEGMTNAGTWQLSGLPITGALLGRRDATRLLIPKQMSIGSGLENRMDNVSEGSHTTNVEGLGRAADALQTALCQSVAPGPGETTVIRVFPAWPDNWDAQFKLLCRGGFLVTSSFKRGAIEFVEVESQAGSNCLIRNPWKTEAVDIYRNGAKLKTVEGGLISFSTAHGDRFLLRRQPPG